jgi:hypothetical protein
MKFTVSDLLDLADELRDQVESGELEENTPVTLFHQPAWALELQVESIVPMTDEAGTVQKLVVVGGEQIGYAPGDEVERLRSEFDVFRKY